MADEIVIQNPEVPADIDPAAQEDFIRCFKYVMMRETDEIKGPDGMDLTMEQIAQSFGVSRQSLHKWVLKWRKNGLMRRIRLDYVQPMYIEHTDIARAKVLSQFDKVIDRQLHTAIYAKSDDFSLRAAQWLNDEIVKPAEEEVRRGEGKAEIDYITSIRNNALQLNPHGSEESPDS